MLKKITFFTIHQAPHNTFTFQGLNNAYELEIFYLKEKLHQYNWEKDDFYYPGSYSTSLFNYIKSALKSDFSIISGWHTKKYIFLMIILRLFKKKFAIYTDLDITTLKKYRFIKKIILKYSPYVFVTGKYGETFLRRYLNKKDVYNFPYGIKASNVDVINRHNQIRIKKIQENNKMIVFVSNRFIMRKGYNMIITLLKNLVNNNIAHKYHFRIAGNGDLYSNIKCEINKINIQCDFLDYIDYNKYINEMLNCDIYLQCSQFEPYGIPPIDAFLNNKVIVATSKIYSIYDIYELNGKVYEFNYNDHKKLYYYFQEFINKKENLYPQKIIRNDLLLFKNIHLNTLNSII